MSTEQRTITEADWQALEQEFSDKLGVSREGFGFLLEWVVMELSGLSEAEKVITWRYGAHEHHAELFPPGVAGDRALLSLLRPGGAPKSGRALAEAFVKAFTALPKRIRAALPVLLAQLRRRLARRARVLGLSRSQTQEAGRSGGIRVRIAAAPCCPHAP